MKLSDGGIASSASSYNSALKKAKIEEESKSGISYIEPDPLFDDEPGERLREQKKAKKKKSVRERLLDGTQALSTNLQDHFADELDFFLENEFDDEEDAALSNQLIGFGRKYARDTAISAESSEIIKAFSVNERRLNEMIKDIDKDKDDLGEILSRMRNKYSTNYKALAELLEVKNQSYNAKLAMVKELNAIKKTQFELRFKENAQKKNDAEATGADSASLFKSLFSIGRGDMIDSVGGYESISGALRQNEVDYETEFIDDSPDPSTTFVDTSSDGENFLKYEGQGVHWVLLISKDDNGDEVYDVIAEDRDGNVVPDYPIPSKINELEMDINPNTMEATDNLKRVYIVRYLD